MKKIFLFVVFLFFHTLVQACAFCGCGNSNFQIGVLPTFSNAFVGVRYTYSHFKTDSGTQFSRDYFHATELWGGVKYKKFQAMIFIPYIAVHKLSDDGVSNSAGLGDITVMGNYQLISKTTMATEGKRYFGNTIWVGGGIKLATGQSRIEVSDPDFTVGDFTGTPGTGSTDYLLNINYNLFWGNNGLVSNAAYKINTKNSQQYQYGNRFHFTTAYFHSITTDWFTFRPSVGVSFVANSANQFQNQKTQYSAGYVFDGMIGLNVQRDKFGLLLNGFLPLKQNLFHGLTQSKERISMSITYSF